MSGTPGNRRFAQRPYKMKIKDNSNSTGSCLQPKSAPKASSNCAAKPASRKTCLRKTTEAMVRTSRFEKSASASPKRTKYGVTPASFRNAGRPQAAQCAVCGLCAQNHGLSMIVARTIAATTAKVINCCFFIMWILLPKINAAFRTTPADPVSGSGGTEPRGTVKKSSMQAQ